MAPVSGSRETATSSAPRNFGALEEGISKVLVFEVEVDVDVEMGWESLNSVPPVRALSFEERPRRW